MPRSAFIRGLALAFLVGGGVAAGAAAAQSPLEADKAAVSAAMDSGTAALISRDWAAYSRLWANSAEIEVIHPAAREWLVGWDTIATKYRRIIADTSFHYQFTTLRRNVHISPQRDMAWGTDESRIGITQGARPTEVLQWSPFVFERARGQWRLVHAHASVPPAPRPGARPPAP